MTSKDTQQTKIYTRLYEIGKNLNETLNEDELFDIALDFTINTLKFEKCLIFKHDDTNGWFKVAKSVGYDTPKEKMILGIINLLLSGEVIEYLRLTGKPIIHTQNKPDNKVSKLSKSLFLDEAYFELFGGDIDLPYGVMIVGNSSSNLDNFSRIGTDTMISLAIGNFISQFSNTLNNIIFYDAYKREKEELEKNISIRTKELEEQKNRFETIYETSKDGIAILDAQTTAFLETNQAFADMTGYAKYELIQTSCLKLSYDKDMQRSKEAMKRVLRDGYITNFIKDCKTKDGSSITIHMSVSDLFDGTVLLSAKDITEQRKLELETKKQKETFEAIYNGSKDAIAILDMKSNFLQVNPAYIEMTGFTQEELLADSCLNLTLPKDVQPSKDAIQEVLEVGYIKNFEKDCIIKDQKYITVNMSMSLLHNPDRILISVRDITQDKKINQIILEEKTKAQQANKAKSQFLANMSHEIRTPMNGILGMSHLALQTNLNNKQKEYLENIDNSAKNLLNIINDILDFSKIEAGKLDINKIDFNFKELLQNVSNIFKSKANEKGLNFEINYDKGIDYLHGDSLRISQILINLTSNAIKFTHKGYVKINISKKENNNFIFKIEDTGIGVNKEQQSKLFQSFSQADASTTRKYGGTGLGLSISKQLVELMGGKIWVESKIGVGSKFIFEIELKQGDENKITKKENIDLNQINTLKGGNILLTEDNTTNQKIILGLLENSGINIDIANNGAQAVDMFKQKNYGLILMDLQMPIMGGIEATKIIRKLNQDIPIVALTANAMKEDIDNTKAVGMNDHLTKPIDVEKLYGVLLKYISKKVDIVDKDLDQKDDIKLPTFKNIDSKIGLYHMNNNKKLYLNILNDFKNNYSSFNFDSLEDDEFKREIHTIKGLSANIGAIELNKIALKLDDTQNKDLLPKIYKELNLVLDELKDLSIDEKQNSKLLELKNEKRVELFDKLKEALISKRAKQYKPVIQEIEKYKLGEDEKLFNQVKTLVKEYKIAEAIKLIGDKNE